MKYLVTGGLGFIGSEIVRQLLEKSDTEFVHIIDNNSKHATKNELSFNKHDRRVSISYDDLTDPYLDPIESFVVAYTMDHDKVSYPDYIIHAAAKIGGIKYFHDYPYTIVDQNNQMLSNVFHYMKWNKQYLQKTRFVYISSSMVFENADVYPSPESYLENCPIPKSHYGFSKLSGEKYCTAYCKEHGLDYIIVRPFNAYGVNEYPEEVGMAHVIPDVIKKIFDGQGWKSEVVEDNGVNIYTPPLEILGDGSQIRCYTHVEDVADGILTAMYKAPSGSDYNISVAKPTTVLELVESIWNCMKPEIPFNKVEIKHLEPFLHDVQKRIPCVDKAFKELGWKAKYSLESKLPETIKWVEGVCHVES